MKILKNLMSYFSGCLVFGYFLILFFYLSGSSLWYNKAFIGGVGNPSSYGFLLIYILKLRVMKSKNKRFRFIVRLLMFLSILLSQALMPLLVFTFIQFTKLNVKIIFLVLIILFFYWFSNRFIC